VSDSVNWFGFEVPEVLAPVLDRLFARETFYDRAGASPYLSRWYVLGDPEDGKGGRPARALSLFVHCIHRSDDDQALHNHPWLWSVALFFRGGYCEERRVDYPDLGTRVVRRLVLPGMLNVIRGDDFHRVDLFGGQVGPERASWSIFRAGPKKQGWGFWDRVTGSYWPKDEFIARVRAGIPKEEPTR